MIPSTADVRRLNYILPPIAIATTLFRLFERARIKKLWWEDTFAAWSLVSLMLFMVAMELFTADPTDHSASVKIAAYYMSSEFFYAVVWSSRFTILATVIHISTPGLLRQCLMCVASAFALAWLILTAQVLWICERNPSWKESSAPQCDLGLDVAIAQVITDVLADATLVAIPCIFIYKVKLSPVRKLRLYAVFSASAITTAVSLNHAYQLLKFGGLREAYALIIEASISPIVANLSVAVTAIARCWAAKLPTRDSSPSTGPRIFPKVDQNRNNHELLTITVAGNEAAVPNDGCPHKYVDLEGADSDGGDIIVDVGRDEKAFRV